MPQQGTPGYLKYRVVDANTGAVVVQDLPHLGSSWTVRAMQRGVPGSAAIGDFRIAVYNPYSEQGRRFSTDINKLAVGQKVEGYLGDVITGTPRFSGVITKINKPLPGNWEIAGSDTLWWLQQSQTLLGETLGFVGGSTIGGHQVIKALAGTLETIWDDDFTTWSGPAHPNSTDYGTPSVNWSISTDPVFMLTSLAASLSTDLFVGGTPYNVTPYFTFNQVNGPAVCLIRAQGVVDTTSASTTDAGGAGVYAAVVGATQYLLARCLFRNTGTDPNGVKLYAVDVQLVTLASGITTTRAQVQNVFTNVYGRFPFELGLLIDNDASKGARVLLNGKDTGCTWNPDVTILTAASGSIGVRAIVATGTIYFNRFHFLARTSQTYPAGGFQNQPGFGTNRFQLGSITNSPANIPQILQGNGQTYLDLMLLTATLDGYQLRKNPKPGYKADTLDYGPSLGSDLSAQIVFEEDVNVEGSGSQISSVADLFAIGTRFHAVPGSDSGGNITWSPVANFFGAVDTPPFILDSVYDVGIPTFTLLYRYVRLLGTRKANPIQAIQLSVIRTADTADKWREWDSVTIHVPSLGLYHQKAQVVGYTFVEGEAKQTVFFNEFPEAATVKVPMERLARAVEFLTGTYQQR